MLISANFFLDPADEATSLLLFPVLSAMLAIRPFVHGGRVIVQSVVGFTGQVLDVYQLRLLQVLGTKLVVFMLWEWEVVLCCRVNHEY